MTKEEFLNTVKTGIAYQRLTGNIMSYIEYKDLMVCPFCGNIMKSKFDTKEHKLIYVKCGCDKAIEYNKKLNRLIKIVEDTQDEVQLLFKDIDKAALSIYKNFYMTDIFPLLSNQLLEEKNEIIKSSFDD